MAYVCPYPQVNNTRMTRFGWIAAFAPAGQGRRWACGLLMLPAVWLAKGGAPTAPAALRGGPAGRVGARLDAKGTLRAVGSGRRASAGTAPLLPKAGGNPCPGPAAR